MSLLSSSPQPQRQPPLCGWGVLCAKGCELMREPSRAAYQVGPLTVLSLSSQTRALGSPIIPSKVLRILSEPRPQGQTSRKYRWHPARPLSWLVHLCPAAVGTGSSGELWGCSGPETPGRVTPGAAESE